MALKREIRPMTPVERDANRGVCMSNQCTQDATHFVRMIVRGEPPYPVEQFCCEDHAREAMRISA